MKRILTRFMPLMALVVTLVWSGAAFGAEAPRMTKEDLKAKIGDPGVVIVDVRQGSDWRASESKIKSAVRVEPDKFEEWAQSQDKAKTYVLYCA